MSMRFDDIFNLLLVRKRPEFSVLVIGAYLKQCVTHLSKAKTE